MNVLNYFLLLLMISTNAWALEIDFQNVSYNDKIKLDAVTKALKSKLPPIFLNAINQKIIIEFQNINKLPLCEKNINLEERSVLHFPNKKSSQFKIILNKEFLFSFLQGEKNSPNYNCEYKSIYTLGLATITRDLATIFDSLNISMGSLPPLSPCVTSNIDKENSINKLKNKYNCELQLASQFSISTQITFKKLVFYSGNNFLNNSASRLIHSEEQRSLQKLFSLNFEKYIFDSKYICRKKSLYKYFSHVFNNKKNDESESKCDNNFVYLTEGVSTNKGIYKTTIDFNRVYEIHYLIADKGNDVIGGFGHSMIRLVICAPSRTYVGPECLEDLDYHIVLSFRGAVMDLTTDLLKGLKGNYTSKLFVYGFREILREYNEGELRNLLSYPLKLNRNEIKNFINRAIETYWGYTSKYYFLTNNCATETLTLLKSIFPESIFDVENINTPFGLLKLLKKYKFIENNNSSNTETSKYKFLSKEVDLTRYASLLNSYNIPIYHWKSYGVENNVETRQSHFNKTIKGLKIANRPNFQELAIKIASSFQQLEFYYCLQSKNETSKKLNNFLSDNKNLENNQDSLKQYKNSILNDLKFDRTENVNLGYGVPLVDEIILTSPTNESDSNKKNLEFNQRTIILETLFNDIYEKEQKTCNNAAYYLSALDSYI